MYLKQKERKRRQSLKKGPILSGSWTKKGYKPDKDGYLDLYGTGAKINTNPLRDDTSKIAHFFDKDKWGPELKKMGKLLNKRFEDGKEEKKVPKPVQRQ